MIQALTLKVMALSLLLLLGQNPNLPEDFRAQATIVANQALAVADEQLLAPATSTPSSAPSNPSPATSPSSAPAGNTTNNPTTTMPTAPASQARIDIVSPIPGKGLGRQYEAAPEVVNEKNYIELGAVVYAADGAPVSTADVAISVNGGAPLIMHGTGDVFPTYIEGVKKVLPVYSFHYEFKEAGTYSFVFETRENGAPSVGDKLAQVSVNVQ